MNRVARSATSVAGVEKVQVDLKTRIVTVTYDDGRTGPDAIAEAIGAGGDVVTTTQLR